MKNIKTYTPKDWQLWVNIYIFINLALYGLWSGYNAWQEGRLDFVEVSFIVQNILMLGFILMRIEHKSINTNISHQLIALFAFFSGMAFMGQEPSGGEVANAISSWVIFFANILGAVALLNLGRSFGILIALRKIKTGGVYSIVRHPMYGADILLRIGFVISHFNTFTVLLFIVSTGAYVMRAIYEEKFLCQNPEYREYMKNVRYRFIPYIY